MALQRAGSKESLFSLCSNAPCSEVWVLGDRCIVNPGGRTGTVQFLGRTQFAEGDWAGVVLDTPDGKNDGSINGIRYFECEPQHGIFCRPGKLTRLAPTPYRSPSVAGSVAASQFGKQSRSPYAAECGFDVGDRVITENGKNGVVKFLGPVDGYEEITAGVVLDRPIGKTDGTVNGKRYFQCNKLYGAFIAASKLRKNAPNSSAAPKAMVRQTKTSALRQKCGSQESLVSVGAMSSVSNINRFGSPMVPRPPRPDLKGVPRSIADWITSLETNLKERDIHCERLSKELEQQRMDFTRSDSRASMSPEHSAAAKAQQEKVQNELEALHAQISERDERLEDMAFKLDEATANQAVLQEELQALRSTPSAAPEVKADSTPEKATVSSEAQTDSIEERTVVPNVTTSEAWIQTEMEVLFTDAELEAAAEPTPPRSLVESHSQTDFVDIAREHAEAQTVPRQAAEFGVQTEVQARASRVETESQTVTDNKKLTDALAQTEALPEPNLTTSETEAQTVTPPAAEFGVQTEEQQKAQHVETGSQTEYETKNVADSLSQTDVILEPKIHTSDMEAQTAETPVQEADAQTLPVEKLVTADRTSQTDAIPKEEVQKPDTSEFAAQTDKVDRKAENGETQTPTVATIVATAQTDPPALAEVREGHSQTELRDSVHVEMQTDAKPVSHADSQTDPDQSHEQAASEFAKQLDEMRVLLEAASSKAEKAESQTSLLQTENAAAVKRQQEAEGNLRTTIKTILTFIESIALKTGDRYDFEKIRNAQGVSDAVALLEKTVGSFGTKVVAMLDNYAAELKSLRASEKTLRSKCEELMTRNKENSETTEPSPGNTEAFLNSIIADQQKIIADQKETIEEQKRQLLLIDTTPGTPMASLSRSFAPKPIRTYCDICEEFDKHETNDCPDREYWLKELRSHTVTSPVAGPVPKKAVERPYCERCEAFLHNTDDVLGQPQAPDVPASLSSLLFRPAALTGGRRFDYTQ
ncbi:CAP-Gly domain containing protein [Aphelenchoides avenae]|nr:CAP-Gly domain containing protein [Aphelenchus avenae]